MDDLLCDHVLDLYGPGTLEGFGPNPEDEDFTIMLAGRLSFQSNDPVFWNAKQAKAD